VVLVIILLKWLDFSTHHGECGSELARMSVEQAEEKLDELVGLRIIDTTDFNPLSEVFCCKTRAFGGSKMGRKVYIKIILQDLRR
jgi:hypothetical protein